MIPMNDFKSQYLSIKAEINDAIERVLQSGQYVLGKNVSAFEEEFARYCGTGSAVGVGNGYDALKISLLALGIGVGDEVITVSNTAVATALAISSVGSTPVFVDINPASYTIDVSKIEAKISRRTKAIIPVHLFGYPADMDPLMALAKQHSLHIIEDACQAHGCEYKNKKVGSLGHLGCFSFYPTKNLGAVGDGGMITTNDSALAERIKMLRNYGQKNRYVHALKGVNSRLDELQAAILRVKLKHLDAWNEKRRRIAEVYKKLLKDTKQIVCPREESFCKHVYHLFVVRARERGKLQDYLTSREISTLIHYPIPIHLQDSYKDLGYGIGSLVETERAAAEILSLPMFPEISMEKAEEISDSISFFYKADGS